MGVAQQAGVWGWRIYVGTLGGRVSEAGKQEDEDYKYMIYVRGYQR